MEKGGTLESTRGEKVTRLRIAGEDCEPLLRRLGAKKTELGKGRRGLKEAKVVVVVVMVEERQTTASQPRNRHGRWKLRRSQERFFIINFVFGCGVFLRQL